ncbi:hypothetical protein M436DRAFT_67807 [Aureobasidium namibiae CBS 147.97]|uniref:Uncharacterized protein n=1 Tax=Aureobasidium namibiae CBS 147.97 TaxID=1043004 RepID=A0A074WG92_9PEZI
MFSQSLLLLFIVSRCSAQIDYSGQDALTTGTISSTELLTNLETSFRTATKVTTSSHSVVETDASTMTTDVSQTHTEINTYSSIPTEFVTRTSTSTSTIDVTEQPAPTTPAPRTRTIDVWVGPPAPTCCSWPPGTGPYTRLGSEYAVDTTCLHPRFRPAFARFIDQGMSSTQFCAQSVDKLRDFFQGRVFNMACNAGEDPEGNTKEFEEHKEEYISCFEGFLETLCGFHIITNTGKRIDSICGKDW